MKITIMMCSGDHDLFPVLMGGKVYGGRRSQFLLCLYCNLSYTPTLYPVRIESCGSLYCLLRCDIAWDEASYFYTPNL